jgi:3-oxoacyl-[acyl-carrier-protein] synthase-1
LHDRSGVSEGLGWIPDSLITEIKKKAVNSLYKHQFQSLFKQLPLSKPLLIAFYALTEAIQQAGWTSFNEEDGLIFATTTGQISSWDQSLLQYLNQKIKYDEFLTAFQQQPLGTLLSSLCHLLQFPGKTTLVTSACSASTQAIALGSLWLKQGRVKRCLIGGSEILCQLTLQGFRSLQLLTPEPTQPFDENRRGINLSEGAGFLCLETNPTSSSPLARISGHGFSTDGYHMTSPHPEGAGCLQAMQSALRSANLRPEEINWVHAHGTGSQQNDHAEGQAIGHLFQSQAPWVSSTKWVHGHALGASGVIESILCIQALQNQKIVKTGGLKHPDPKIILKHPPEHFPCKIQHIMKNTLGFGGTNASLVLSQKDMELC